MRHSPGSVLFVKAKSILKERNKYLLEIITCPITIQIAILTLLYVVLWKIPMYVALWKIPLYVALWKIPMYVALWKIPLYVALWKTPLYVAL